jgi:hypothetical protein
MTNKHFILYNIPFTQRSADNFVDITAIFMSKQKIFANYSRIKAAKENFNRYENSVIKSNKHTWCDPRCIKPVIEWLLKPTIIDFSTIQEELDKPFPTDQIPSKCKEKLSKDNFESNKLKKDNLDVRCNQCYNIDRDDKTHYDIIRKDGYINVTKLCKKGGKKFSHWKSLDKTKTLLNLLSSKLNISEQELIKFNKKGGNNERAIWVHPLIATNVANWISVEFSVALSYWIEEWRNTSKINNDKYLKELNNLNPYEKDRKEKEIQLRLQTELNGEIEVKTKFGFIDLLTDTEIIEIKNGKSWKHGLGQLCVYSKFYPDHQKRLHLFNIEKDIDIEKLCEEFNIKITYE